MFNLISTRNFKRIWCKTTQQSLRTLKFKDISLLKSRLTFSIFVTLFISIVITTFYDKLIIVGCAATTSQLWLYGGIYYHRRHHHHRTIGWLWWTSKIIVKMVTCWVLLLSDINCWILYGCLLYVWFVPYTHIYLWHLVLCIFCFSLWYLWWL